MFSKLAFGFALLVVVVIIVVVASSSSSSSSSLLVAAVSYDPLIAWPALWYSKVSACTDADSMKSWTCGPSCAFNPRFQVQGVHVNSTMGDLAFTGWDAEMMKAIVLSFQGTKDEAEALVDLDFTQIQYPFGPAGALVHQGFFREWNSYGAAIMSDLQNLLQKHPDAKFILPTGHSLGAAVALLGGLDAIRMLRMNASLPQIPVLIYTFGAAESAMVSSPTTFLRRFYLQAAALTRCIV
jgi:hypothetical protein